MGEPPGWGIYAITGTIGKAAQGSCGISFYMTGLTAPGAPADIERLVLRAAR
jgi:hypothetical protein